MTKSLHPYHFFVGWGVMQDQQIIEQVAEWLRFSSATVVLTGAGISTESGIPDFRGPQGVWTRDPEAEKRANIQYYMANRDARVASWKGRRNSPLHEAQPNSGHLALAELERKGKLHTLVTQNVDSLHMKAGNTLGRMIEIHGTVRDFVCMGCGERGAIERVMARVEAGEDDPPCRTCGGILKSATISFGQNLVSEDLERAQMAAATCEVFLAIGTSLVVTPVAYLPQYALQAGAKLVIITAEETPFDRAADAILRDPIGEVLPAIVDLV
jgi:NAD-dependent deacetylase